MENILIPLAVVIFLFISGIRIIRPTSRGLIERFGKYNRFASPGFNWIIPLVENVYMVNITEQLVNAETQEIITNDNLTIYIILNKNILNFLNAYPYSFLFVKTRHHYRYQWPLAIYERPLIHTPFLTLVLTTYHFVIIISKRGYLLEYKKLK